MKTGNNYLVETALMTHGVSSLSNKEIMDIWNHDNSNFVWLSNGKLSIGTLPEFLRFKDNNTINFRISSENYLSAKEKHLTGALTASGTMCACEDLNLQFAVSAGIGGISHIKEELICPDLYKILSSQVTLIATSFKDMMDRESTFKWLKNRNINVYDKNRNISTGFMFNLEEIKLNSTYKISTDTQNKKLLLNEILASNRIQNINILEKIIKVGKDAESKGKYYHPAANNKLAELTNNKSAKLQIQSLLDNVNWANSISS